MDFNLTHISDFTPNQLDQLFYLALNNFKKCYLLEEYECNSKIFHSNINVCYVNLQGALMIDFLESNQSVLPKMFSYELQKKFYYIALLLNKEIDKLVEIYLSEEVIMVPVINLENLEIQYTGDIHKFSDEVLEQIKKLPL